MLVHWSLTDNFSRRPATFLKYMVKNEYGKTAWGKAFLEALGRIDYSARLGRGKTYANTGKVKHLVVSDNGSVSAVVQGTSVYKVTVKFNVFSGEKKTAILDIIQKNVLILGKILFGELPPDLLDLLTQEKIHLFPVTWYDMNARCSCPDDANPCKHMAAVYFHLTTHIDRDPFTLFRLRGINLIGHFGISQSDTDPGYPLPTEKMIAKEPEADEYQLKAVVLSKIPDMADFILDCLKQNPPYCLQLDFKDVLKEFYEQAQKKTPKIMSTLATVVEGHWSSELDLEDIHRVLAHSLIISPMDRKFNDHTIMLHNDVFDSNPDDIGKVFCSMPHKSSVMRVQREDGEYMQRWVKIDMMTAMQLFLILTNDFGSPSYRWFYYAFRIGLGIINARAFIPDVLPLDVNDWDGKINKFKIIWKPLRTCEIVAKQLDCLHEIFPMEYNVVNLDQTPLDSDGSAMHLLTSLLTLFVHKLEYMHKKLKNTPPKESVAFFTGSNYPVFNINEENTAKSIAKEFGVFDLMKLEFKIHVYVEPIPYGSPESEEADYTLSFKLNDKENEGDGMTIRRFLTERQDHRTQVLKLIATLHPYLPMMHQLLEKDTLPLIHTQLEQFVMDTANIFTNIGVIVVMPKELKDLLRPEATLLASAVSDLEKFPDRYRTFISMADMLNFDWMISLGDKMVSVTEFKRLVANGNKLIKYNDKYIAVSGDEMKKLMTKSSKKPNRMSPYELLKESLSENTILKFTDNVGNFMKDLTRIMDHQVPENLNATLRPYQVKGYQWMLSNLKNGFGSILADDMGLGKTIQTITVILKLKNEGTLKNPVLIVVPASVLSNWDREIQRFAPSLSVVRHYGSSRFLATNLKVPIGPLEVDVKEFASPKMTKRSITGSKIPSIHHAAALGPDLGMVETGQSNQSSKWYLSKAINKSEDTKVVDDEAEDILAMEKRSLASVIQAKKLKMRSTTVIKAESSSDSDLPDLPSPGTSRTSDVKRIARLNEISGFSSSDSLPDLNEPSELKVKTESKFLTPGSPEILPDLSASVIKKEMNIKPEVAMDMHLHDVTNSQIPTPSKRKYESLEEQNVKKSSSKRIKTGADIIITTYQLVQRDVEILVKNNFDMIVIDEAQKIKNAKTSTAKALKRLKAPMRAALSGTPVENNLNELWSVFDFVLPKYLGTAREFGNQYSKPIETRRDPEVVEALKNVTAPFMLRRLKTDRNIIKDLPDKIVENQYITLTADQAALYESKVKNVEAALASIEDKRSRNGYIFELMLRLKQICNHPANYHKEKVKDVDSSGKMKLLVELLETILSRGEKVLIFTQFVEMIKIMSEVLQRHFHVPTLGYHGGLTQPKREEMVTQFQTQPHFQILIVSTKAGGVGLNLTAANHVVHYDLWYNPAVENQATDRAFRIGQQKNVFVYRFITENTFEEKIDYMIQQKKELSDLTVSHREQWIGNLSNDQIKDLFTRN